MEVYRPIEYPKWIDGVVVQNAAEEEAHRAILAEIATAALEPERARPSTSAAVRMRRTRERRREGKRTIRCEISTVQIEALANAGFIDPVMRDDAAEVARGVSRSIDRLTWSSQGTMT